MKTDPDNELVFKTYNNNTVLFTPAIVQSWLLWLLPTVDRNCILRFIPKTV